jgi:hypothetical protein
VAAAGAAGAAVRFSHDPRLSEPLAVFPSERQLEAHAAHTRCPALCILSDTGWPWPHGALLGRISSVPDMELHHIVGGHRCHLDASTGPTVAAIIQDFLRRRGGDIRGRIDASKAHAAEQRRSGAGALRVSLAQTLSATLRSERTAEQAAAAVGADLDAEAVAAAGAIATVTASTTPLPHASPAPSAAAAAQEPIWTDRHIFTARCEPLTFAQRGDLRRTLHAAGESFVLPHAVGEAQSNTNHALHLYKNRLRILRMADEYDALYHEPHAITDDAAYGEELRQLTASGQVPSVAASVPRIRAKAGATVVWTDVPDAASGVDRAALRHTIDKGLRVGAAVPLVFLQTVPTVEAVTHHAKDAHVPTP